MTGTAHGAGALTTMGFALPALAFAIGPIFKNVTLGWQTVGPPDMFPDNNYVPAVITIAPGDRRGRQEHRLHPQAQPDVDTHAADPVQPLGRDLHALRAPRLPGPLGPASERFICPCHGGVYDLQGVRVGGPPPRPLDRFYTRLHGGLCRSARATASTASCAIFSPRDPGEPLDGIGQYLYPSRPSVRAF